MKYKGYLLKKIKDENVDGGSYYEIWKDGKKITEAWTLSNAKEFIDGWNWIPKQKILEFNSEKEAQEYVEKWNKSHPMTQAAWQDENKKVILPEFKEDDRCCDECNGKFVIPGRMMYRTYLLKEETKKEKNKK